MLYTIKGRNGYIVKPNACMRARRPRVGFRCPHAAHLSARLGIATRRRVWLGTKFFIPLGIKNSLVQSFQKGKSSGGWIMYEPLPLLMVDSSR